MSIDTNNPKDIIQKEAIKSWIEGDCCGIIAMATGTGKSRVAIMAARYVQTRNPCRPLDILLIVPTQKLRDENWQREFEAAGESYLWEESVTRICYASASKQKEMVYDLIILDEAHRLTPRSAAMFEKVSSAHIIGLTATPPQDMHLFEEMNFPILFEYNLGSAVKAGLVSNLAINIIKIDLDNKTPYLSASKKSKQLITEKAKMAKLNTQVKIMHSRGMEAKWAINNRARVLRSFMFKEKVAEKVMDKLLEGEGKFLVFCSSIEQAERLCKGNTFHSKSGSKNLDNFMKEDAKGALGVIKALNEGMTIPGLHRALIVQVSSSERDLIQRIGRTVRVETGKKAEIWILCYRDTQDEVWLNKAMANIDPKVVTVYENYMDVFTKEKGGEE